MNDPVVQNFTILLYTLMHRMEPKIILQNSHALREYMNNSTLGDNPKVPGAVLHIVDAKNNTIFSHGSNQSNNISSKSIGIIHSLTKLVGAIALLQLVDRGLVDLDDPSSITKNLPELAAQRVLVGYIKDQDGKKQWQLEDRQGDITPRMLLNHTYGGGHQFFNSELYAYFKDLGIAETTNEVTDSYGTVLASPLLWQPGTRVNYGQGLDWIAVLVERLSNQTLCDYLQETIFAPLDLDAIGFEPGYGGDILTRDGNKGRFWPRVMRLDGNTITVDAEEPALATRDDAWPKGTYHSAHFGTGLMSSAEDYARLMTVLLPENMGVDPKSGHRLLSADAVNEIISPQLPDHIDNTERYVPSSDASPIVLPILLSASHMDPAGSFGLACGLQGADRKLESGKSGRRKGSAYWFGAANSECWIDREEGFVAFVNGNYYPWNEEAWLKFVADVEGMIYERLQRGV